MIEMDTNAGRYTILYGFSDFELDEDFDVSSPSASISSDFTPLGSIRKLEDLCSSDLYSDKTKPKAGLGYAF